MKYLFILLLEMTHLYSSPVQFFFPEGHSLKDKIKECSEDNFQYYKYKPADFELKNINTVNREIEGSARQSAKSRLNQMECIRKKNFSSQELEEIIYKLNDSKKYTFSVLEFFNRRLYSGQKKNNIFSIEKKTIPEYHKFLHEVHHLLYLRTEEYIKIKELKSKEAEYYSNEVHNLYRALYRHQYEFLYNLNSEFRNELLKEIYE